jgi:hypothetical protein
VKALAEGGHTVYFRHAITDRTQADRPNFVASDCAMQRNLSEEGRTQARRIGAAISRLRIPVGEVIASPYCRTMQTARLVSEQERAFRRGGAWPRDRGNLPDFSWPGGAAGAAGAGKARGFDRGRSRQRLRGGRRRCRTWRKATRWCCGRACRER